MSLKEKHIQLLETAERLFAEKGFEGTSVRDIADVAGVNIAMISYYFGSKEKLMQALFEKKIGDIELRVVNLIKDDSLTSIQKVEKLIDEHVQKVMGDKKFHRIMVCEQIINKNPAIINLLKDIKLRNAGIIGELIKDGQKKGDFKKKVDVVMLLSIMIGTVTQLMINHDFYRDFNKLGDLTEPEYEKLLQNKATSYIKKIFKALLVNES